MLKQKNNSYRFEAFTDFILSLPIALNVEQATVINMEAIHSWSLDLVDNIQNNKTNKEEIIQQYLNRVGNDKNTEKLKIPKGIVALINYNKIVFLISNLKGKFQFLILYTNILRLGMAAVI